MSNNAVEFCRNKSYLSGVVDSFLKKVPEGKTTELSFRLQPRTRTDPSRTTAQRNSDYNKALSFETFDPLWMLARQWQFGRFQGNDCGTPVSVKVNVTRKTLDCVYDKNRDGFTAFSTDRPLEYDVERENIEITPYVRVESAMYLKKLLKRCGLAAVDSLYSKLAKRYPLPDYSGNPEKNDSSKLGDSLDLLKVQKNKALQHFSKFYSNRAFDGYELFKDIKNGSLKVSVLPTEQSIFERTCNEYAKWFEQKFNVSSLECWNHEKLGYEACVRQGGRTYQTENYASGKLSWYSFDCSGSDTNKTTPICRTYIPVPATFAGAPSQKLWEFENRKVMMGNGDMEPDHIASALVMQYISMYGNDWMVTPLETETGTVLEVEKIEVVDSFGNKREIRESVDDVDKPINKGPMDRWCMFGNSKPNAYDVNNFSCDKGLFFPPTVARCEEGAPFEEVQFLRDEMANMLWGVETKINDGCGGFMDGKTLSDAVFAEVDKQRHEDKNADLSEVNAAKYSMLIQNRVPMNWIPFIPEQLKDLRNIVFRRGTMPVYYQGAYNPVRPSTKLLAVERDNKGNVLPFRINEEEIGGYGVKVIKNAQRTRWFYGKTFNWVGSHKVISEYQANSGLMFDDLLKKSVAKVETERTQVPETDSKE